MQTAISDAICYIQVLFVARVPHVAEALTGKEEHGGGKDRYKVEQCWETWWGGKGGGGEELKGGN